MIGDTVNDEARRQAITDAMKELRLHPRLVAEGAHVAQKTVRRLLAGDGRTNAPTLVAIEKFLAEEKRRLGASSGATTIREDALEAIRNGYYEKAQALALLDLADAVREAAALQEGA